MPEFAAVIDLASLDGTNGFRLLGIDSQDFSGLAVASAGDINGDGFDDLIIGAFGADPGASADSGESYVIFGRATNFNASISLAGLNGSNGFRLDGIDRDDHSGGSVASAGDVNGDGFDDLLIGAPLANPGVGGFYGECYLVFGTSSRFGASFDLATLDGANGFRLDGIDAGDKCGSSVASAGDINGDGFDDLVVGAFEADPGVSSNAGECYVVFGSGANFAAAIDLATLDGTNGFRLDGIDSGDLAGRSVSSAGDVNGDGLDDLVIGAYGGDPGGRTYAGESYVVFGKASGFAAAVDLASLDGNDGFRINGIDAHDRSGTSVASAGDVNGDGYDDVVIGAPFAKGGGQNVAGESYVVFGRPSGIAAVIELASLDGTNGFRLDGVNPDDTSGSSVASAGDVNGDGFDDLIVGAPQASPGGSNFAGQGFVVFGKASGFSAILSLANLDGANGFRLDGIDANDRSGRAVASAGDLNGDGFDDLIVGASGADPGGDNYAGESYVIFGHEALVAVNRSGTSIANRINGGRGDDVVNGLGGDDTLFGRDGNDLMRGGIGNDTTHGGSGDDTIFGNGGHDVINGGSGDDVMAGGAGDDRYFLSGPGDTVIEAAGEGIDTIVVQSSFTLAGNFENLTLGGTGHFSGTGNALANVIKGNGGANALQGLDGNDTLDGGAGNDTMTGGLGDDTYVLSGHGDVIVELAGGGSDTAAAEFTYTLLGQVENLVLDGTRNISGTGNSLANAITGNSGRNALSGVAGDDRLEGNGGGDTLDGGNGADLLFGGDGNDRLDGGLGNDAMAGGRGNDTYTVNALGDTVTELANQGTDLVLSSVRQTLGANVENLTLTGSANIDGTGNGLANAIAGNGGANTLTGLGGADRLDGGAGADILIGGADSDRLAGGADADTFRYTSLADSATPAGRDRIEDFAAGVDTIDLSGLGFSSLVTTAFTGVAGQLRAATGANTLVFGDVDGDKVADFQLQFVGAVALTIGDFIL